MKKTFFLLCFASLALLFVFDSLQSLAQEKGKDAGEAAATESTGAEKQPSGKADEESTEPEAAKAETKEATDEEKAAMEEEIKKLKEKVETLEQEGGKIILLMDGKIRYTVEPGAVMDYEEIVVLMEQNDPVFKENMQKGGKDADGALLGILKLMSPDDRKITAEETKAFMKTILQTPVKQETASAPETEEAGQPAAEANQKPAATEKK